MPFIDDDSKKNSTITVFLILLLIVMTVSLSIIQTDLNDMVIQPPFVGSRYFYVLIISFGIIFLSAFLSLLSNDISFYSSIILIIFGIIADLYIVFAVKDKNLGSDK
jgi:hypothetical protein